MERIQSQSIARKLTWMNMLVSGTALLLACVAFIGYDWATFRTNSTRNLSIQAQIIATESASAVLFNDPESANQVLAVLKKSPNILSAGLFTANGKLFASYQRTTGNQLALVPFDSRGEPIIPTYRRDRILAVVPIVSDGETIGSVYIESNQQTLYVRLIRYLSIGGIVWAVSLLAALLVSALFRRSVSGPVTSLVDTARIVSREKKYSLRVPPAKNVDEIGILIGAFNEMLEQIERRDQELQNAREQLETRVEERTAQLAASNKELEAFSYSVSHDLRGPLRSIDGFSQAVLEDYSDRLDDSGKEYLQRVRSAAVRMGTLIDDLLKLSRVARSELHREPTDLTLMAKSIAKSIQEEEPARCVEFHIGEGLATEGDSRLLRVVMENLIGNAWKYTSRHEHALIEIGQRVESGQPIFYVKDDGAGFDPRYADRLFGAFQRLHGMKEFPGTGVGLATVQRIIHKHGGEIWAESEIEKGATFYFSI